MISILALPGSITEDVEKELVHRNHAYQLIDHVEQIQGTNMLILPDSHSFPNMMEELHKRGFAQKIQHWSRLGLPLFAFGMGMKLLFRSYDTINYYQGLNLFYGNIEVETDLTKKMGEPLDIQLEIPHPLLTGCYNERLILFSNEVATKTNSLDRLAYIEEFPEVAVVVSKEKTVGFLGSWSPNQSFAKKLFENFMKMSQSRIS